MRLHVEVQNHPDLLPIYQDDALTDRAAELLRAVAHPIRLRLVAILCEGSCSVTELCLRLDLKQAVVSQQLAILRSHRIVAAQRRGGLAMYRMLEPRWADMVRCLKMCALPRTPV